MQLRFHVRMLRQEVPGEGHGDGRRLVAGLEDGDELVADLLRRQARAAFGVLGADQAGKQVGGRAGQVRFPLGNHPVDCPVHAGEVVMQRLGLGLHAHGADQGQQVDDGEIQGVAREAQRCAGQRRQFRRVGREHGVADDLQRDRLHLLSHVDLRVVQSGPAVGEVRGGLGHGRGIGRHGRGGEGRRHDPAVLLPLFGPGAQQTLAEHRREDTAGHLLPRIVGDVFEQDAADRIRMVNHDGRAERPLGDEDRLLKDRSRQVFELVAVIAESLQQRGPSLRRRGEASERPSFRFGGL